MRNNLSTLLLSTDNEVFFSFFADVPICFVYLHLRLTTCMRIYEEKRRSNECKFESSKSKSLYNKQFGFCKSFCTHSSNSKITRPSQFYKNKGETTQPIIHIEGYQIYINLFSNILSRQKIKIFLIFSSE
jgi:hypothetical protein